MDIELQSGAHYNDLIINHMTLDGGSIDNCQFFDCTFKGCSWVQTTIRNCTFNSCTFIDCDLSLLGIPQSIFSAVSFQDCKLVGVNWTLANWSSSRLGVPITFDKCAISHSTFIGLSLPEIQITNCVAENVDFRDADLTQVDFSGTDLVDSLFLNTQLTSADLRRARNYNIAPDKNLLKGTRFSLPEALALLYNLDIILDEHPSGI